jgi:hypothetical protein
VKEAITGLANALKIGGLIDQAFNLYKMAMSLHYQRATQETASICLYVICRRTKGNLTLLIDFASQINVSATRPSPFIANITAEECF